MFITWEINIDEFNILPIDFKKNTNAATIVIMT